MLIKALKDSTIPPLGCILVGSLDARMERGLLASYAHLVWPKGFLKDSLGFLYCSCLPFPPFLLILL